MGKFHNGVLGTMTGKVGGVVGRTWKGINTVASYQPNVSNPRTNSQMAQRGKLSTLTGLASQLNTGFIKPLWDRDAKKMSGFNAFIQANMSAVDANGDIVWNDLIASRGKMVSPVLSGVLDGANFLTVNWSTEISDAYSQSTDKIFIAVVESRSMKAYAFSAVANRSAGTCTVSVPTVIGDNFEVLCAFRREDGSVVSNSSLASVSIH